VHGCAGYTDKEAFLGLNAFGEKEELEHPLAEIDQKILHQEEIISLQERASLVFKRLTIQYGIPLFSETDGIPPSSQTDYDGVFAGGYWSEVHGKIILLLAPALPEELTRAKRELLSVSEETEDLIVFQKAEYSYYTLCNLEKLLSRPENMSGQKKSKDGNLTTFQVMAVNINIIENCVKVAIFSLDEEKVTLYREAVIDSPAIVFKNAELMSPDLLIGS
jgi:hypothetical protein